jgi:hypothetical protein
MFERVRVTVTLTLNATGIFLNGRLSYMLLVRFFCNQKVDFGNQHQASLPPIPLPKRLEQNPVTWEPVIMNVRYLWFPWSDLDDSTWYMVVVASIPKFFYTLGKGSLRQG